MGNRSLVAASLTLAAVLSGCVGCAPGQGTNPVDDLTHVVDLIPWARDVADIASVEQLTARIQELAATLPSLDIPDATKTALVARLDALEEDVADNPADFRAGVTELARIIADVKSAMGE